MGDPLRWWEDPEQLALLWQRLQAIKVDRRDFLRIVTAAGGASAAALALEACGGGSNASPTAPLSAVTPPPPVTPTPVTVPTAAATATAPAAGTTATQTTGELAATQVLRVSVEDEPQSFDFNKDLYCGGDEACFAMLGMFNPDNEVVPDIAERWEPNQDASVWTFHIRKNTYWSNGDPVTAHDYEWSWKRQLDPETQASYAAFLYDIKNAQAFNNKKPGVSKDDVGVKALDDYTLQVTLEGPRGYFPVLAAYIAAAPAHRPSVEKYGDKWTEASNIVCNGPFKLVEWKHEQGFVLEKNDKYWNAKNITLQRIERPIIKPDAAFLAYQNNEIDILYRAPLGQLQRVQSDPQLSKEFHRYNLFGTWYIVPDPNFEPYNIKEVRLAMAHSINRDVIVRDVLKGLATPAYTMTPPGIPFYIEDRFDQYTKYDPDLARSLLKGTPYEGGKNWPKGMTMTMRREGDAEKAAGEAVIAMLKDVLGMPLQLEVGEPNETYDRMWQHKIPLMWVRWYVDYPDPANTMFQVWYSKQTSGHRHSWSNPQYDQLVLQASGETDPAKRLELYKKAQEIQLADGAAIYVYNPWNYALVKPWITNLPKTKSGDYAAKWNIFLRDYDYYRVLKH